LLVAKAALQDLGVDAEVLDQLRRDGGWISAVSDADPNGGDANVLLQLMEGAATEFMQTVFRKLTTADSADRRLGEILQRVTQTQTELLLFREKRAPPVRGSNN
jgi:hypothetical protein